MKVKQFAPSVEKVLLLLLALLINQGLGCSYTPITPRGPWIGGFSYGGSNPLVTTDSEGVLVSNLVLYNEEGSQVNEALIVIDASTGSVRPKASADEDLVLTPHSGITEDVTAGYGLSVNVAADALTATIQVTQPDGGDPLEFTVLAPDNGETELVPLQTNSKLVVSTALNVAYIMYGEDWYDEITHYAVLDLSTPNTDVKLEEFGFYSSFNTPDHWPMEMYEDLQIISFWDGTSCYGRFHLHYNETNIVNAEGMEYYTHTRAIERGETIRDHSYYSLEKHSEVVESDSDESDDDSWYYEDRIITNYTLRERDVITGELLQEIMLNMTDIQAIADDLNSTTSSTSDSEDTDTDTDTAQDRKFVRGGKKDQGKKKPNMPKNNNHDGGSSSVGDGTSTLRIQTALLFEFFHHGDEGNGVAANKKPENDDIGSLIGATLEFFREVLRKQSHGTFVDWSMTNVRPSMDHSKPNEFTLDFVSNIVVDNQANPATVLTARDAANIMSTADYKKYIGHFARGSPSSRFHSTFKVQFRGVTDNSIP